MSVSTLWRRLALPLLVLAAALPARAQYNPAQSIPVGFLDISNQTGNGLGTAVTAAEADEAVSAAISFSTAAPGFTFNYFGVAATTFQVSSNGWMGINSTGTSAVFGNTTMPSTTAPNSIIAPFWDDLDNDDNAANLVGSNAEVDYYYDSANSRFIVQWTNFRRFASTPNPASLTFQVQLYASGVIEYHYATMSDPGVSYTVGLENAAGTIGQTTVVNGAFPLPAGGRAVGSNTAFRYTLATTPLPLTLAAGFNFPSVAGECSGFTRSVTIPVINVGVGDLVVTGATSSSTAFGVGTPQTSAGVATTYPITLAPGASFLAVATYFPSSSQTGPQTGTFTVNTNGGAVPLPLSGSGSPEGAGYLYRSSLATGGCAGVGADAPGTAFIPITSHTRIGTWTTGDGNDGRFALALSTLGTAFPSFRFNGTDVTTLQILSNGLVSTATTAVTFYGANATTANTIQAAAMNLTTAATVAADAAGVGGAPGVFYGLSDVDGDGDQELVVTWWHAYDFGSTPGTAGQYLTVQLVLFRGNRPNEEAYYEVRFLDGNDANGVAYRQNTGVADSGTDVSIENDAVTAVTESGGIESATYRFRNGSAGAGAIFAATPLYATGGGSTGVRFQAEIQSVATGQAGWRMMGVPVRSATVARLAGLNLVQSITGQYPTFPQDNLYTGYDGTAYVAATSTANALTPGRGFIWYLFNQNLTPTPTSDGGGTSVSYALPMNLQATGAEPAFTLQAYPLALTATGNGFNLLANPFRDDLDVSGIGSWATGGTLASVVPQVWDPNAGGAGSYVIVSGSLSTWQGFFVENRTDATAANTITFPTTARNTTGTFLGREGRLYSNEHPETAERAASAATVAFELAGTAAGTGVATLDRAATLVLDSEAADAWDVWDATKLSPLSAAYATIGFQGESYDARPVVKSQESRSVEAESFDVPLVVDAVGTESSLTLSWNGLDDVPADWSLELRDVVTGATVDLRAQGSYTFDQTADAVVVTAPEALVARTTTGAQAKATADARFVLHVTTGRTTGTEAGAPTVFALAAPAPNPTASVSTISFDVPEASAVNVAVYDLLGRRVATLVQGQVAAGRHTARLDAGQFAPGVYVVRMEAGTFAATQRVTVVR